MDSSSLLTVKPTLVRRVSDLFKDGNSIGTSPLLFNNTSIQKLRHCCQNIGLFPYLLYSLGDQKFTIPQKHNLSHLITRISEKIFHLYGNIRQTILTRYFSNDPIDISNNEKKIIANNKCDKLEKFQKFQRQPPKTHSFILILIIYLAPLILAIQLIVIISLLALDNYTPGFVFLLIATLLLGGIAASILLHKKSTKCMKKRGKRKIE